MYDSELLELHTESYQRRAIGTPQCIREWSIKTISIMEVLHHSWLLYSFFLLFFFFFFTFSHVLLPLCAFISTTRDGRLELGEGL